MEKNILITGLPGIGKTTLIKEIVAETKIIPCGFYTEEIREKKTRVGFKIKNFKGKEGILAHVNVKSAYSVGKYKVLGSDLIEVGVKEIYEGIKSNNELIVIDEIGKMELFFSKFKEVVILALDSKSKVLGTVSLKDNEFTKKIKAREDTKVLNLNRENYKYEKNIILKTLDLNNKNPSSTANSPKRKIEK